MSKFVPTVVFDFDGVVHSYKSGWKGETVIPDPVVPGIADEIARFRRFGYRVVVVSTRCATEEGLAAVKKYLRENRIEVDAVQKEKPPAICYIDDRAMCFRGNAHHLVERVACFKSWTEGNPEDDEAVKGLRKCLVSFYADGEQKRMIGHFHGWATDAYKKPRQFGSIATGWPTADETMFVTNGMVELSDGSIVMARPKDIIFLDRGAEPVPEMGEWVIHTEHFTPYRRCSKCGWEMPLIANESEDDRIKFPHCPGCGLPMKGEF